MPLLCVPMSAVAVTAFPVAVSAHAELQATVTLVAVAAVKAAFAAVGS